jgi:peptide-N4-(N-acetyl-beta-glucosaminyl)asparagine amidase
VELSALMGESPAASADLALLDELLKWFKTQFFTWVNNMQCEGCSSDATRLMGGTAPTPAEASHGAARVEVYACASCGRNSRFPRYNDPVKLLETRKGRCGEWANCFALCCAAAGFPVRLVVDLADHVWVEVYSNDAGRWIHADPCEGRADAPLLYSVGWGKKLSCVLAVGSDGAVDVTRRYVRGGVMHREWLKRDLAARTAGLRSGMTAAEVAVAEARDAAEEAELVALAAAPVAVEDLALPGRQTGSAEWVAARGEGGAAKPPPSRPPTRWQWARDDALAATHPGRICGGAARASGDNQPGETAARVFDGAKDTKWLDFGFKEGAWLEYALAPSSESLTLKRYALTSGDDSPERDPEAVVVEAFCEDSGEWRAVDERQGLRFGRRGERQEFDVARAVPAKRWRLRVLRVLRPEAANSVQLAGWDLYST